MIAEGSNLPVWFLHSKSGLLRDRFLLSCFTFFILFPEFSFCFFFVSRDDDGAGDEVDDVGFGFFEDADFHFDLRDGAFGDRAFVYFGDVGFFESEGLDSDGDALEGSEAEFEVGCVGFFEEGCCFFFVSFFLDFSEGLFQFFDSFAEESVDEGSGGFHGRGSSCREDGDVFAEERFVGGLENAAFLGEEVGACDVLGFFQCFFHDGRVGVFEGDSFEGRGVQVGVDALFEEVVGEGTGVVEDVECLSFGDFVQDEEVFRDDFEVQGEEVFFRDDGEELGCFCVFADVECIFPCFFDVCRQDSLDRVVGADEVGDDELEFVFGCLGSSSGNEYGMVHDDVLSFPWFLIYDRILMDAGCCLGKWPLPGRSAWLFL